MGNPGSARGNATPAVVTRPAGVDDSVRHSIKVAFATMRRELEVALRVLGMTVPQWRALDYVQKKPGLAHSDLVLCLEIEAPSVTSLVDGMERKGWMRRERCDDDGRVKRLYVTPRGRRMLEAASGAIEPIDRRMTGSLSAAEAATLRRLLTRVTESLH
jgi:MarR family transcriptional regulator, transcriptional regulator for hemolysin